MGETGRMIAAPWSAALLAAALAVLPLSGPGRAGGADSQAGEARAPGGGRLLLVAGDPSRSLAGFTARDRSGRKVAFASGEEGHPLTVVSFFATCCCVHCKRELRELRTLEESFPSLRVLLVSLDAAMTPAVASFVEEAGLRAPLVHDDAGSVYAAFGMEQLPQTYVLDRRGRILIDGRRFGEGAEVPSWTSPQVAALLRRAERGEPLGLPGAPRD